jgi:hypothetical protein
MRPPRESRIRTEIQAGEGPDGEDVVLFIDNNTGETIRKELRRDDAPEHQRVDRPGAVETKRPSKIPSAQELMRLAIKEREQTLGLQVSSLIEKMMDECRKVILDGICEYNIPPEEKPSGVVLKQAVKELKGLGYKVSLAPSPDGFNTVTIKWPTKDNSPKKKVMEKPAPIPEEPKKRGRKRSPKEEAVEPRPEKIPVSEEDTPDMFTISSNKPEGWRPPRRVVTRKAGE